VRASALRLDPFEEVPVGGGRPPAAQAASDASLVAAAATAGRGPGPARLLRLRPIFLPVKATSVVSESGGLQSWVDRWQQAKRHAQGMAELSYLALATYDMIRLLPLRLITPDLWRAFAQLFGRLLYIHILPACQFAAMAVLLVRFVCSGFCLPECAADELSGHPGRWALCALAGAWMPAWPVFLPTFFIWLSNVLFVAASFLGPRQAAGEARGSKTSWHSEDAGVRPGICGRRWTLAMQILFDLAVVGGPVTAFYGIFPALLALWSVFRRGNRFEYVTATKAMGDRAHASSASERGLLDADTDG